MSPVRGEKSPGRSKYQNDSDLNNDLDGETFSGQEDKANASFETEDEPPMTPEQQQAAIEKLVKSMKDCSKARDNPETSQALNRIKEDYYPEEAFFKLATRNVVSYCIDYFTLWQ